MRRIISQKHIKQNKWSGKDTFIIDIRDWKDGHEDMEVIMEDYSTDGSFSEFTKLPIDKVLEILKDHWKDEGNVKSIEIEIPYEYSGEWEDDNPHEERDFSEKVRINGKSINTEINKKVHDLVIDFVMDYVDDIRDKRLKGESV